MREPLSCSPSPKGSRLQAREPTASADRTLRRNPGFLRFWIFITPSGLCASVSRPKHTTTEFASSSHLVVYAPNPVRQRRGLVACLGALEPRVPRVPRACLACPQTEFVQRITGNVRSWCWIQGLISWTTPSASFPDWKGG